MRTATQAPFVQLPADGFFGRLLPGASDPQFDPLRFFISIDGWVPGADDVGLRWLRKATRLGFVRNHTSVLHTQNNRCPGATVTPFSRFLTVAAEITCVVSGLQAEFDHKDCFGDVDAGFLMGGYCRVARLRTGYANRVHV